MRPLAGHLSVAAMLVAVPMSVAVLAARQHQMPLPVTAATRHHYYEVGAHECEHAIKRIETQAQAGQLLGFSVLAGEAGVPQEFRHALAAGCRSAAG
jgi:hypothetical protein